ncbi:MAG: rRNA maturation RNase YbeY [Acidobacteriota bacterium]|jgi:probable rRNA maturation factor
MITLELRRELADKDGKRASASEAAAWKEMGLSRSGLTRYLQAAQKAAGLLGEVDVLLAGDRTLRRLNREFRGKDKATDVLSFPSPAEFAGEHAGDLAISLDTAQRQAREQGHTLRDEVRILLLHGVLHLLGMDHETDGGAMASRESHLRARLRLPHGLIARADRATVKAKGKPFRVRA